MYSVSCIPQFIVLHLLHATLIFDSSNALSYHYSLGGYEEFPPMFTALYYFFALPRLIPIDFLSSWSYLTQQTTRVMFNSCCNDYLEPITMAK